MSKQKSIGTNLESLMDILSSNGPRSTLAKRRLRLGMSSTAVSAARPPTDYTARVIPHCQGVAVPLEDARILRQR